jgi:beta-lactamase class A
MGASDILVLRGVEDTKAYQQGLSNTTTAYDLLLLFENIAQHQVVSDTSCEAMIDILLDQEFNEIIPGQLPAEVKVAHKTGWITGLHHDSGIVYLPDGRKYVLVLLSKNLEDEEAGVETLATVSRMIYDYLQPS